MISEGRGESKGLNLAELNHKKYMFQMFEFLNELRECADNGVIDKVNDCMQFVPDLKNLSYMEHRMIMKTIKLIENRIYYALDEVDQFLPLWYDHFVEKEKNESVVVDYSGVKFHAYQDDVESWMECHFKNIYLDFICGVFFNFKWILQSYNEQSPSSDEDDKPELYELLKDFVNIYIEKLCENFVKENVFVKAPSYRGLFV